MTTTMNENAIGLKQYDKITRDLLLYYTEKKESENLILSPMSIMLLLSMLSSSTAGETSAEIQNYLRGDMDYDGFEKWFLADSKAVKDPAVLHSANAVCLNKSIKGSINAGFGKHLKAKFDAELFCSDDIVSDVNHWVKKHTNGMIEEIADKSMEKALLFMINAMSFDASWEVKYIGEAIQEGKFRSTRTTSEIVPMLHSIESEYIEDEYFTGMVKPYKGRKYALMALLPKKFSRQYLHQALEQVNLTELYKSRASGYDVYVTMPEFTAEFDEKMTEYCRNKGISTCFKDQADFSRMSSKPLKVDQIVHKAKIEVNSQGTKAVAVSFADIVCAGAIIDRRPQKHVTLTRPFVYAIAHTETGIPVFAGIENRITINTNCVKST